MTRTVAPGSDIPGAPILSTLPWHRRDANLEGTASLMSSAGGAGNSREFIAKHESGHAVGFLALGWELNYVTITVDGSQLRGRTQPVDPHLGTTGQRLLVAASGVITGFLANGWRLTDRGVRELFCGSDDNHFEALGMSSGALNRLDRAIAVGPSEDLEPYSIEGAEIPFVPENAVAAWRDCEMFVASTAHAVDAIAQQLVVHDTLSGDAASRIFDIAMLGRPAALLPLWINE